MRLFNKIFRKTKKTADTDPGNIPLTDEMMRKVLFGNNHLASQNTLVIGGAGKGHGFVLTRENKGGNAVQRE